MPVHMFHFLENESFSLTSISVVPASKRADKQNKGFNMKQHKFKKAQKAKIFRHVETKKDRKDMRTAINT